MIWKTISLKESVYRKLEQLKEYNQSFSDIVERLIDEVGVEMLMKDVVQKMNVEEKEDIDSKITDDIKEIIEAVGDLRE